MIDYYLKEILKLKSEKRYDDAIKIANNEYKEYKAICFLNEIYDCYIKQSKRKEAIKILKKILKVAGTNPDLEQKLAFNYFLLGKYQNSIKYYKKVLDNNPSSSEYNFNLGCAYHCANKFKQAEKYYKLALEISKTNISALNNLGLIYYKKEKWDLAISLFKKAISINSSHPEAYHHLGIIQREYFKDYKLSELYLKKAIYLDPKHMENYFELAQTYEKSGNFKNALYYLGICLKVKPHHKGATLLLKKLQKTV